MHLVSAVKIVFTHTMGTNHNASYQKICSTAVLVSVIWAPQNAGAL